MEPGLKLFLLRPPCLERDGRSVEISRRKALALLAYLAVTHQGHSRDTLATLLWPDADQSHARAALRRVLSDLNKATGEGWLESSGEIVSLRRGPGLEVDVIRFHDLLAACRGHGHPPGETCPDCVPLLSAAAGLYRDHFMTGFGLPDSPEFDEWQFFEAENLRRELAGVLEQLVSFTLATPDGPVDYEAAIPFARRWVLLDPLQEQAQRALIELYAWSGRLAFAQRQYQEYARLLSSELGLQPPEELTRLYEQIRRGQWRPTPGAAPRDKGRPEAPLTGRPAAPPDRFADSGLEGPAATRPEAPAGAPVEALAEARPEERAPVTAPGAPAAEIRLVTVLFVGLARDAQTGWENDPAELAAAARRLLEIVVTAVQPYGAWVERFVGAGVHVLFGAPQAHEDDAARALHAALEIVQTARSLGLPAAAGAGTGQVFYSPAPAAGSPSPVGQGFLAGPALQLAARLQERAAAGQVLAGALTARLVRGAFELLALPGEPGEAEPAYQVHRALPRPAKLRGIEGLRAELVGRDDELARLKAALAGLLDGQGGLVALLGEAGLGKSRLVAELKKIALEGDPPAGSPVRPQLQWLESRCLELRAATSYWPFIDLLQTYLYRFGDDYHRGRSLFLALQELVEGGYLTPARSDEIGPLLGRLLSITFNNAWDERLKNTNAQLIQRLTFQAVYDFIVALSRRQPLVLVFDDLHWADELSMDLLYYLMESVAANPVLLVCLLRTQPHHIDSRLTAIAGQKIPGRFTRLRLHELPPEQILRMVQSLLHMQVLPPEIDGLVMHKAHGNPFFVEEAIRSLIDQNLLRRTNGAWQIDGDPAAIVVPESVQSLILSRVDRLDPDLKLVLRCAAVIGQLFPAGILAQITAPGLDLERALWALEEAALIYRERIVPEVAYAFRHVLIQETVYGTIATPQRGELHRQVAEAIELRYADTLAEHYEALAYHYPRSPEMEKAVVYLLKAGEKLLGLYHNAEASDSFQQALRRCESWPAGQPAPAGRLDGWRVAALTGLGQVHHRLGRDDVAEGYLQQAIQVGQAMGLETGALLRLYYWLGEVMHWQWRYAEQVRLGEAGLALLAGEVASVEAVLLNQTVAIGALGLGDEERFRQLTRRTASFIRRLPYSEELRPAYVHIALSLYNDRRPGEAGEWLELLERLAGEHHDLRARVEVYDYRFGFSFQSGDLAAALTETGHIQELQPRLGNRFRLWRCQRDLAWVYLLRGDLRAADEAAQRSLAIATQHSAEAYKAEAALVLGLARLNGSDLEAAAGLFRQANQMAACCGLAWTAWVADYCLGQVALSQGDLAAAGAQFTAALERFFPYHLPLGWWFNRWPVAANILSGIERCAAAQAVDLAAQVATLDELRRRFPGDLLPVHWPLAPAGAVADTVAVGEAVTGAGEGLPALVLDPSECTWIDPAGDGACRPLASGPGVGEAGTGDVGTSAAGMSMAGLTLRAGCGRDLWHLNLSAPRLLRPVTGDFALQVTVRLPGGGEVGVAPGAASAVAPAIGGLLLWQDEANFVRLVYGLRGSGDISFEGCLGNENVLIGRGLLPGLEARPGATLRLRLELRGDRVRGLAALPAGPWWSAGEATLPVAGSRAAGLHAAGWIDPTIYPGAWPEGTAITFIV